MRRLLCSVVVVASVVPLALSGSGAAASGANGVVIPATPREKVPAAGGTFLSTNWSGYAVTSSKHKISSATATFAVPALSGQPSGFASTWVGIGGFKTRDLIQAGASEQSVKPHYFAWFEMLPNLAHRITRNCTGDPNCSVSPGDQFTVTITQVSSGHWTISLTDQGNWSWSKNVKYKSSRSSAEWILEAPTINGRQSKLPGLGTALFGPTSTFVKGTSTRTIAQGKPSKIIMLTRSGKREATPSALASDGQSFDVCAWKKTCSTP